MSYEKSVIAYAIMLVVFLIVVIFAVLNLTGAYGHSFRESDYLSNYFPLKMNSYSKYILEYMK